MNEVSAHSVEDFDDDAADGIARDDARSDAPQPAEDKTGAFWMLFALLVLAAATLLILQAGRPSPPAPMVGLALPPLEVGGWINAEKPLTAADLRGKLVLVNFWGTDCPACVLQMPSLVSFYQRFRDQGLTIVGLTAEPNVFGEVTRYVKSVSGLDWPIGYGAGMTFELMSVYFTPTYILYDKNGKSVWAGPSLDGVEDAAVETLAR